MPIVIPDNSTLVAGFLDRHGLAASDIVDREEIAICSSFVAHVSVDLEYSRLPDERYQDPAIGVILNLLHRNFELVEASTVAFVTGSGAASEVVSRASVEASANVAYMLSGNATGRMLAYFDHYFRGVDRQVKAWRTECATLTGDDAKMHQQAATRRQESNDILRDFVAQTFGVQNLEQWPSNVERRLRELGMALSYRTFYARMSSETHGDAEETLRYFVGRVQETEVLEAMALETVWNTRLYLYYAISSFLRASSLYCERYVLVEAASRISQLREKVEDELHRTAQHIGARV